MNYELYQGLLSPVTPVAAAIRSYERHSRNVTKLLVIELLVMVINSSSNDHVGVHPMYYCIWKTVLTA